MKFPNLAIGVLSIILQAPLFATTQAVPGPYFPDPVYIQLKSHNFSTETIDEVYDIGFRGFRRGMYWNAVETEKGVYDFSAWQKEFDHAKAKGMRICVSLFGGNPLYEDDGKGGIQTEAGRKGFANFSAAAAEHFKDYPIIWEIWNEPNVRSFWRKDGKHNSEPYADEYTALVIETTKTIHKKVPDAFVIAGSVSNYWQPSYEWTEYCFQKGILDCGIQGWSVHPYGVKTPEEFAVGHTITRDLLQKYGKPNLLMFDTERGFSIKQHIGGGEIPSEGWSGGSADKAHVYQAWHYVRQYMMDQMYGIRATVWYQWDGDKFGIKPGFKVPVEDAAKAMHEQLSGYKYIKRLPSDNERDFVMLWESKAGERQLVVWTSAPPQSSPDETLDHSITLDGASGSFTRVDLYGNQSTVSGSPLELAVTGAPQYIVLPDGVAPNGSSVVPGSMQKPKTGELITSAAEVGGKDLGLFTSGNEWKLKQNNGDGSFALGKDGNNPIGIVTYDFTNSTPNKPAYLMAQVDTNISAEAGALHLNARTPIRQPITFRFIDSTGQNLQHKTKTKGTGDWEPIIVPLDKQFESWGGANDRTIHFPIKQIKIGIVRTDQSATGKVELADLITAAGNKGSDGTQASARSSGAQESVQVATVPASHGSELNLFATGASWKLRKNNATGSIVLKDNVGVVSYQFQSGKKGNLVAITDTSIPEFTEFNLNAIASAQQSITVRFIDSTRQTLQARIKLKGTGEWEPFKILADRKFESWGGANDGKIHFPIQQIQLGVNAPSDGTTIGAVQFAGFSTTGSDSRSTPQASATPVTQPAPTTSAASSAPISVAAAPAISGSDLNLFAPGAKWKLKKNKGDGSISLENNVGVVAYDFQPGAKGNLVATTTTDIPQFNEFNMDVLASTQQSITVRFVDSTKQNLQARIKPKGTGQWESFKILADRKFESWGGANDGKIHFPIQQLKLSVSSPSDGSTTGAVQLANFSTIN
ncbi:hypothetical protein [Cerasicoccus frondis]|uniref:hypothetical protein n=1 Tax=Cerasicoccus frondis TaxID=490090 RepID=UPI002852D321|nr:hypothetical protein [Cerasicoccus frondis]